MYPAMEQFVAYKTRCFPTPAQIELLEIWHRQGCVLWNAALEERRAYYRSYKTHVTSLGRAFAKKHNLKDPYSAPNLISQSNQLTRIRENLAWSRQDKFGKMEQIIAPSGFLSDVLANLDTAYQNFFEWVKNREGRKAGPPRFKSAKSSRLSITFQRSGVSKDRDGIKRFQVTPLLGENYARVVLPKLGSIRFRKYFDLTGKQVRECTLVKECGHWYLSFAAKFDSPEVLYHAYPDQKIGLDMGIKNMITDSNGAQYYQPDKLKAITDRIRVLSRRASKKKCGSKNSRKAADRIAILHAKAAAIRKGTAHQNSTEFARSYGLIAVENLKIDNMTKSAKGTAEAPGINVKAKSGLNREILNQGWGMFQSLLEAKAVKYGAKVIKVAPHYTSQKCSACGHVDRASRKTQSLFSCTNCHSVMNADHNAAINIIHLASAGEVPVEMSRPEGKSKGKFRRKANARKQECPTNLEQPEIGGPPIISTSCG